MSKFGYTVEYRIETMARAYGRELPLAWKKSVELARQLRGKTVDQAREYLEKVIALKQPVPMKKYKRWVAHKAGTGPARYPVKAAKAFLIDAAHERPPGPGGQELDDLFERHGLHLIERVPSVRELLLAPGLDQPRALPQLPSRGFGQPTHLLPRHRQDLRRFSFNRFGFGDIRPTFRPGGASKPTVDGFPTC